MNRDDIIRMAREAGLTDPDLGPWTIDYGDAENAITYFANLVAAAERKACLSILRDMEGRKWHLAMHGKEMKEVSLHDAYKAICARGLK